MPRNTKRQVTPLATQPLVGPGFRGLNTELANGTGFFEPEWAVALDNIVFDDRGRLNTRRGYRDVTDVPAGTIPPPPEQLVSTGGGTLFNGGIGPQRWASAVNSNLGAPPAGTDRLLVVTNYAFSLTLPTAMTYGGQPMEQLGGNILIDNADNAPGTNDNNFQIFFLREAQIAMFDGNTSLSRTGTIQGDGTYTWLSGVDQANPFRGLSVSNIVNVPEPPDTNIIDFSDTTFGGFGTETVADLIIAHAQSPNSRGSNNDTIDGLTLGFDGDIPNQASHHAGPGNGTGFYNFNTQNDSVLFSFGADAGLLLIAVAGAL